MHTTTLKHFERACFLVALIAWPALAFGGESDGETLFAEGRKLRMSGDCAGAVVRFRQALEAYPEGLGSLRNIAECQQELGLAASARRSWWELRRRALKSNDPKYKDWAAHAESAHGKLEASVPRLTINLSGGSLDGVRVLLNDEELPSRLWGVPVERDVGEYRVEVQYWGPTPFRRVVDLSTGAREVVTFTLPARGTASEPKPTSATGAPAETRDDGSIDGDKLRIGGFVALGVGVLGSVGFGVALGVRQAALDDLDAVCADYQRCNETAREPQERG